MKAQEGSFRKELSSKFKYRTVFMENNSHILAVGVLSKCHLFLPMGF